MYKGYTDVKIKSFFDQETYGMCPGGGTYVTVVWATEKAEEFINLPNIHVIDLTFTKDGIYVIYQEGSTND